MTAVSEPAPVAAERGPQSHRTIDRMTSIVEQVVYCPGITFVELARAVGAPKSSVHGFIRGLLAAGWLRQDDTRFYIGPAMHGLSLASGHLRAGSVTEQDLHALHTEVDATVVLGVQAGDDLIYVAVVGNDDQPPLAARWNIRRDMLATAGGKALIAAMPPSTRDAYLRRRRRDNPEKIDEFVQEFHDIVRTRIARNYRRDRSRVGFSTVVHDESRRAVAEVTIVGPTRSLQPRASELEAALLRHVDMWAARLR